MVLQVLCLRNRSRRARRCVHMVGSPEFWRPSGSWAIIRSSFNRVHSNFATDPSAPSSQVMPFIIPLTYFYLLPHNSAFISLSPADYEESTSLGGASSLPYTPLPSAEDEDGEEEGSLPPGPRKGVSLSPSDKWRLVRPLLLKYMLPLCESPYPVFQFTQPNNITCSLRLSCKLIFAGRDPLTHTLFPTVRVHINQVRTRANLLCMRMLTFQ